MASSLAVYTGCPATNLVQQQSCETTLAANDNDDAEESLVKEEQPRDLSLWSGHKNFILGFLMTVVSMGAGLVGIHVINSLVSSPSLLLYSSLVVFWYIVGCEAVWWIFGRGCQCFLKKGEKERLVESVKLHSLQWNAVGILLATYGWMIGGTAWTEHYLSWFVPLWVCVNNLLYTCWHLMFVHQRMNQQPLSEEDEDIAEYKLIDSV